MSERIRIKFLSKTPLQKLESLWGALLPKDRTKNVTYTFDPDDRDYDFLAVYEDLPPRSDEKKILRREILACPPHRTLLITPEPSSIRQEGLHYLGQFGCVWTSRNFTQRERKFLQQSNTLICNLPLPLRWFYGRDMEGQDHWPLAQIKQSPAKTADLSTITSDKNMPHTLHRARLDFIKDMKARLGQDMDLYGRGFNPVRNKADAMAPYRYHIAIENHVQPGHHTEKLTDCFLAECLAFYFGDPEYAKTYPREAVIPINIYDPAGSEGIIREAIAQNTYAERLPHILKAKQFALERTNTVTAAQKHALTILQDEHGPRAMPFGVIEGRHAFRRNHPVAALRDVTHNIRMRKHSFSSPIQGRKPD